MGTHPIFESDFDCLTDSHVRTTFKSPLASVNFMNSVFVATKAIYRGISASCSDVNKSVEKLSYHWDDVNFRQAIALGGRSENEPCDMLLLANTGAIHKRFGAYHKRFNTFFKKRAFLHWYENEGCGMSEFIDAAEQLAQVTRDYEMVNKMIPTEAEKN